MVASNSLLFGEREESNEMFPKRDNETEFETDGAISDFSCFSRTRRSSVDSVSRSMGDVYQDYTFEHGRRYHNYRDGLFMLPNDDQEQVRMDIFHQMLATLMHGELHLCPLQGPQRILDVGTGTGIWAIEMASKYPNSRVYGIDLSPIQVDPAPGNCVFEAEDAEADWAYPTNYFDLIHTRMIVGGIADWPAFFSRGFSHIRPGGWMEVHESPAEVMVDGKELSSELPLIALTDNFHSAWNKLGRSWGEVKKFVCYMENAGFVDVEATIMRLPLGTWPSDPTEKLVGRYNLLNFLEGVQGHCLQLFTKVLDMDLQEARQLITLCEKDVQNRRHRIYFDFYIVRGRKPV